MLGKTHMTVGVAATLAVIHPTTPKELLLSAGVGAIGALISDIDVGTSDSHKDADKVIWLTIAVVAIVLGLDKFGHFNIVHNILQTESKVRIITGIILFIGVCAFGKEQPHRSFMHSILALILLEIAIGLVYPLFVLPFGIGFLSHIITDLFNRKRVRLWYPLPGGLCLGLFHAHGLANTIFFISGFVVSVIEIFISLRGML